jgi:hypothetical protein
MQIRPLTLCALRHDRTGGVHRPGEAECHSGAGARGFSAIPSPAAEGAGEPNLTTDAKGRCLAQLARAPSGRRLSVFACPHFPEISGRSPSRSPKAPACWRIGLTSLPCLSRATERSRHTGSSAPRPRRVRHPRRHVEGRWPVVDETVQPASGIRNRRARLRLVL